jgi:hypothetical protein
VSIASAQSNPWANPWAASSTSQSGTNAPTGPCVEINEVQANFSTSVANAPDQNATGMSGTSTSPANPLQTLASDIQAMLIQAQSAAPTGAAAAGTTQATTPEQNVASDLQTLLGDIQGTVAPNAQTANSNAAAPTGETEPHHHHHHHEGDGEANGASDVATAATTSDTGTSTAGSQLTSDQAVSSIFATDIAQAIQAYGGGGSSAAMPALMV